MSVSIILDLFFNSIFIQHISIDCIDLQTVFLQKRVYYNIKIVEIYLASSLRSSPSEVFLGEDVLKIYCKFTREYPCQSVISIKLQNNFIEITLRHRCSPINLLYIFNFQNTFSYEHLRVAASASCRISMSILPIFPSSLCYSDYYITCINFPIESKGCTMWSISKYLQRHIQNPAENLHGKFLRKQLTAEKR